MKVHPAAGHKTGNATSDLGDYYIAYLFGKDNQLTHACDVAEEDGEAEEDWETGSVVALTLVEPCWVVACLIPGLICVSI